MKLIIVQREDIPQPIPFHKKSLAFVKAYCQQANEKTGLKHTYRIVKR